MTTIIMRRRTERRGYRMGRLARVCIQVDPDEWARWVAHVKEKYNLSASEAVRQVVAEINRGSAHAE